VFHSPDVGEGVVARRVQEDLGPGRRRKL